MTQIPWILFVVPVLSTLTGGLLALRFRRSLSYLVAVSAGLLLGAAFLDLLPEAIDQSQRGGMNVTDVLSVTLLSFLFFFALEVSISTVSQDGRAPLPPRTMGQLAGVMLIFHSFRDGMAIGASYAASPSTGYAVALGIAAHDLGDGMNTILLTTRGETPGPTEIAFLAADCIAPFAGGLFAFHWLASAHDSVLLLAIAAGFFLQMATGDLLPHVRSQQRPRTLILGAILLGTTIIYMANRLLGHAP